MTDIAIVGIDCRFPQAPNVNALWDLLLAGGDGITAVPPQRWRARDFYDDTGAPGTVNNETGGFIADADAFDLEFFGIAPREAQAMDPQQRLLLQTAWRAFEDATLDPKAQAGSNTGVYVGVMANEWNVQMSDLARITPQLGSGNGYFMTANRVSYTLDLKGPSIAVDTACSSSLVSIHLACSALRAGECDQALAGGVNIAITPALNVFYNQAGLSAPDGRCKPFSGNADGIGRGEGVALLVLRRLDDAVADGLPIRAVIKASAINNDGRSNGITAPSRWAQQTVIGETYRRAGVDPARIAFVEAHGTGTVLGDMIEVKALGNFHATTRSEPCGLGSIKGNLGHTEGAAGVAGVIKAALALQHKMVPPSRFAADENPRLRLASNGLRIVDEPMPLPEGELFGAVSSFGLGGTNAHLVLASAPTVPEGQPGSTFGVVTLSSNDREGLRRNAIDLAADFESAPADGLGRLCWSTNVVKSSGRHRLAFVVTDRAEAVAALRAVDRLDDSIGVAQRVKVGWVCTGQGSQYPGMAYRLAERHSVFRCALTEVDEHMSPQLGRSLLELLGAGHDIDRTEFAQPAIFAVEYALTRALTELGIEPAWLLGHSIGEYAVATHAGVLGLDDACRLVAARARLMQQLPRTGSMLAVRASRAEVDALLADEPTVACAAVNGPGDVVLSGESAAVRRLAVALAAAGHRSRALTVSHAFHSPLMEPMQAEFNAIASGCAFDVPRTPVYSTLRGRMLLPDEPMDAGYWTEHIREPVLFAAAVAAAVATAPTHLLEVGPKRVLLPMIRRSFPDNAAAQLVPCPGPDADGTELAATVAALYRDGLDPQWDALYDATSRVRTRLSGYNFATSNRFWMQTDYSAQRTVSEPEPSAHSGGPTLDSRPDIEESTMDQLIALFREQTAVLAAAAQNQGLATDPVTTQRITRPQVQRDDIATAVRTAAARVSGFPVASLITDKPLIEELGFDSIMVTDLLGGLRRTFPGLAFEPGWLTPGRSLDDVIAYVSDQLDGSPRHEVAAPEPVVAPPARTVEPESTIGEFAEVQALADRLTMGEAIGVSNPYFLINDGVTRDTSVIGGETVINFSSYNYIGMSGHPVVVAAVQDAVARYGSSVSASRLLSGDKPVHRELEEALSGLLGTEDAITLVGGHSTNVTVIGHLVGEDDLVVHDALAHDSILQGCKLSGATRRPFPHNDIAALDAMLTELRSRYRRVLILIEGVYSQDGDIPDLPSFVAIKKKHRAMLMIDEAHSIGVLGATGGGIGEHFAIDRSDVELWSGTLSKALAGCGGYVCGSAELVRFLKYTTPGFVYSVGMTPMNAAASLAAIRQLREEPEVLTVLRQNSQLFLRLAKEAGIDTGDTLDTPVIPCIVGDSLKTLRLSNRLLERGINVNPILYPAVPEDLARLRFFVTSCHTEEQITYTVATLTRELAAL
ncbi:type I polyketide synthase [Antrihabitans sp. NCIMB 15449]|uniref:Type I polyketide synthase n=1 Tax=Antrihabitans spumae TaxID=3373370 RepID=A0ABW7JU39_9NOCA